MRLGQLPLLCAGERRSAVSAGRPAGVSPQALRAFQVCRRGLGIEHPLGRYVVVERAAYVEVPPLPQPAGQYFDESRATVGLRGDG